MYFSISFEADRLCLKDLSQLVTDELNQRLKADATAMEKVSRFFGLKGDPFSFSFLPIEHFFPDTTVSVLKRCFEALRLNDLAEILAKVKPRALCPALSSEQVEKLQLGDRRTKHYSNMAVVVVDVNSEKGTADMIETFFKDLNPKNEVNVIPFTNLRNKYRVRRNIEWFKPVEMRAIAQEKQLRHRSKIQLPKTRMRIKREGQEKSKSPEREGIVAIDDSWRLYHDPSPIERVKGIQKEGQEKQLRHRSKIQFPKTRRRIKREGQEKSKSPEREGMLGEGMLREGDSWRFYYDPSPIERAKVIPKEGQEKNKSPEREGKVVIGDSRRFYYDPSPIERVKVIPKEGQEKNKSPEREGKVVIGDSFRILLRGQHSKMEEDMKLREETKKSTEWIEDIEKEESDAESALLNVMDKWIQYQGK